MELKYLHINEKEQKKELLISHKQVNTLKKFLLKLICDEVIIINTNIGLEIYYQSSNDFTHIIKKVLAIIISGKYEVNDNFQFLSFQNENEIQRFIDDSIAQVGETPLFLNYTKSMLSQLKLQCESNKKLIAKLSDIWNEVSQNLCVSVTSIQKIQGIFQDIHIENLQDRVLKELLTNALDEHHVN